MQNASKWAFSDIIRPHHQLFNLLSFPIEGEMSGFNYQNNELHAEQVPLQEVANQYGTPCYVYSKQAIIQNWHAFYDPLLASQKSFNIYYAVKANSNLSILNLLAKLGSGFDVVSGGEIDRVLRAGGNPNKIVYAGVGKSVAEISKAIDLQIHSLHVESEAELLRIQDIAKQKNKIVNIALRLNPDVASESHPYISTGSKDNKFGIDYNKALEVYKLAASLSHIAVKGIACHIGSQITTMTPFLNSINQLLAIIDKLKASHIDLEYIDIGGGLGISYNGENPPTPQQYISSILEKLKDNKLELHIEPGRALVANSGALLTRVEYLKSTANNNFAIVDAAMNDLMRPALYKSFHDIVPVHLKDSPAQTYSIVGPICESGDFLANNRSLNLQASDLLAIKDCGAYGFSMSSNYNSRPRCAEVMVDGSKIRLIRQRETIEQLLENENFEYA